MPNITNCILWGNTAANDGHEVCCDGHNTAYKATVTLKYCDIQNTTDWEFEVNSYSQVLWEPQSIYYNIFDNPDFVNISSPKGTDIQWATSDDGFMLDYDSACLNKGDDITGWPEYISDDITGNDRKIGSGVDIGAYEYDPN